MASTSLRERIYYWKCDRPSAFHGVLRQANLEQEALILEGLQKILKAPFPGSFQISRAAGEGGHRTYLLHHNEQTYFVRVEDGPEGDTHLEIESDVLATVAESGIPVPRVFFCDTSRRQVPFAIQVITYYNTPDLNRLHRAGGLSMIPIAEEIGRAVARWQRVPVEGFGPFKTMDTDRTLIGFHPSYSHYFNLHLERHLHLLQNDCFLSNQEAVQIRGLIKDHSDLLNLEGGCLVHKDLALWNILGTKDAVTSFIDWDDAISGDPTDDLSLLACFHSADFLLPVLRGYESVHPLPPQFSQRFWMHMLRNMIVKAVIRSGAGYFTQTKGNFLMPKGSTGSADLREVTREKLLLAYHGLRENRPVSDL